MHCASFASFQSDFKWYKNKISGEFGGWYFKICNILKRNPEVFIRRIYFKDSCKKIILTTDQDLIKDGVQAIDDEFIEWFVKNPCCEEVEVESKVIKDGVWTDLKGYVELPTIHSIIHKIIIPQEEPKQETLEELSNEYAIGKSSAEVFRNAHKRDFIAGFKACEEQNKNMYSEEEVENILIEYVKTNPTKPYRVVSWFQQFKKK